MEEYKIDPTIAYDVVELPSQGIYYPNNKKSVKVAYLTASDENILTSPNLIASNAVVTELLRKKILDRDINVDDLVEEDKQAILIFLRNTAFGSDYIVTLIDEKTNKEFKTVVDLSILKVKDFTLVPDSNNEYNYHMLKSNVNITFKFLTKKQLDELTKLEDSWNGNGVAPVKTKELEYLIKSINGNRDLMEIYKFIDRLPIKDSQEFKKFVFDNKPGINLKQDITTPSGDIIQYDLGLGLEFFRPFYGI